MICFSHLYSLDFPKISLPKVASLFPWFPYLLAGIQNSQRVLQISNIIVLKRDEYKLGYYYWLLWEIWFLRSSLTLWAFANRPDDYPSKTLSSFIRSLRYETKRLRTLFEILGSPFSLSQSRKIIRSSSKGVQFFESLVTHRKFLFLGWGNF